MFFFKLFAGLLGFYILFIVILYFYQGKLVYLPPILSKEELKPLAPYKIISVTTEDSLILKGYFLKPAPGKPLIVVFHGNASHPAYKISKFREWSKDGYGFLLAEYRGYGGNPGMPSEKGLYKDGEAYMKWVEGQADLSRNPVILYGESLGSGVAVDAAAHHKISALILEVTFSSLADVGAWHYPYIIFARQIMNNKFPNEDKIKNIKVPVLFLLAEQDEVVGVQFGQKLADLANQPKEVYVFKGAHHNDIYQYGAAKAVNDFIEKYVHD